MSNESQEPVAGHRMILGVTAVIIAINLLLAWKFGIAEVSKVVRIRDATAARQEHGTPPQHGDAKAEKHGTAAAAEKPAPAVAEAAKPAPAAPSGSKASGTATAGGSEVEGVVTLSGTPPPEKKITPITTDKACGPLHATPPMTRSYVVGGNSGLANVFIHIKTGLEGKTFPTPAEPALIDQVGCLYEPYVIGAMAGQTVNIRNSDPLMHNVNFGASASGNKTFNFAQATKGQVNAQSFAKPEIFVKLQCNVHPWMFGYIGVVGHPFFAITDKDGKFSLPKGLPAGDYVLEAYHLKAGKVEVPFKKIGRAHV